MCICRSSFFFFKQKTAYEMRISDWSSDVCSSDLVVGWVMLVVIFSSDIGSIGGPLDWLILLLRVLTPVATIGLLAASAWHLTLCVQGKRRWTMTLGAGLLLLAALLFVWVTILFNLSGFSMVSFWPSGIAPCRESVC